MDLINNRQSQRLHILAMPITDNDSLFGCQKAQHQNKSDTHLNEHKS